MAATASPRPAHIAVLNIPAHGHVNPTLGIVAELVRRGHRVSYAVPEEFGPQVRAAGAALVPYETTLPASDRVEDWPSDDPVAMMRLALREAVSVLPGQLRAFEADPPDLVLHDFGALTGRLLAHRLKVRCVCLSSTHVSTATAEEREQRQHLFEELFHDDPRWQEYRHGFRKLLDEAGITLSVDDYTGRPERCLVPIPRFFQLHGERADERYAFTGPCLGERSHQGEWRAPAADTPVLLVALGTAGSDRPEFYRRCARAFAGTPWHVVMATGRLDPALLGPLPGNVETRASVPQLRVLARAKAFITHAGMGSVLEAMHHGVPMVAVPQVNDQPVNAARIADLGLGRHLPQEEATVSALREAVFSVASDPAVARRVTETRARMRRLGGASAAAELIESQLPGGTGRWQELARRLEFTAGDAEADRAVPGTTAV
ncbi:macrolide family glycosyltransferase [Streptomyces lucensis]|nr:macrolide family glycosyltransferase [Streptomyces lucensis]